MRRGLVVEGLEHLEAARAGGRGVIVVSGHFSTLEMCGRLMCDHAPLAGMYRPHAQPAMEWAVRRGRARYAAAMFPKQDVRGAVRHLKKGGLLWYFDAANPEVLVKVLNGCGINDRFWVYMAATTNVGFVVTITDTQTGVFHNYQNTDGVVAAPVQDVNGLDCTP